MKLLWVIWSYFEVIVVPFWLCLVTFYLFSRAYLLMPRSIHLLFRSIAAPLLIFFPRPMPGRLILRLSTMRLLRGAAGPRGAVQRRRCGRLNGVTASGGGELRRRVFLFPSNSALGLFLFMTNW